MPFFALNINDETPVVRRSYVDITVPMNTLSNVFGKKGIESIIPNWNSAVRSNNAARYFHTPGWYEAYLNHLADVPGKVGFFAAYQADVLFAVLPYVKNQIRFYGLKIDKIDTPLHPHLPLADITVSGKSHPDVVIKFINLLRSRADLKWDVLHIANVLEESVMLKQRKMLSLYIPIQATKFSNYILCDPKSSHVDMLKTSFKRNLRRLLKHASKLGNITFEYISDEKALPHAFNQFLKIEASGWKGAEGTNSAIMLNSRLKHFYEEIVNRFSKTGNCQINLMKIGDNYVAGHLCLITNGTLHLLKIGYDQEYEKVAPGSQLLFDLIQKCTDDPGIKVISFVTGPEWTKRWHPHQLKIYDVYCFNRTIMGYLYYFVTYGKILIKGFMDSDHPISVILRKTLFGRLRKGSLNEYLRT